MKDVIFNLFLKIISLLGVGVSYELSGQFCLEIFFDLTVRV